MRKIYQRISDAIEIREAIKRDHEKWASYLEKMTKTLEALRSEYGEVAEIDPDQLANMTIQDVLRAAQKKQPNDQQIAFVAKNFCSRPTENERCPEKLMTYKDIFAKLARDEAPLTTQERDSLNKLYFDLEFTITVLSAVEDSLNNGDHISTTTSLSLQPTLQAAHSIMQEMFSLTAEHAPVPGFNVVLTTTGAITKFADRGNWMKRHGNDTYKTYINEGYAAYQASLPKPVEEPEHKPAKMSLPKWVKNLAVVGGSFAAGVGMGRYTSDSPELPEPPRAVAPADVYDRLDPNSTQPAPRRILEEGSKKPAKRGNDNSVSSGPNVP